MSVTGFQIDVDFFPPLTEFLSSRISVRLVLAMYDPPVSFQSRSVDPGSWRTGAGAAGLASPLDSLWCRDCGPPAQPSSCTPLRLGTAF